MQQRLCSSVGSSATAEEAEDHSGTHQGSSGDYVSTQGNTGDGERGGGQLLGCRVGKELNAQNCGHSTDTGNKGGNSTHGKTSGEMIQKILKKVNKMQVQSRQRL